MPAPRRSRAEADATVLLTVPEVAATFQVTAQTIRNWIDHGALPAVRVGRAFRVRPQDVDALLERAAADSTSLATRRSLWEPETTTLPHRHPADTPRSVWDDSAPTVDALERA